MTVEIQGIDLILSQVLKTNKHEVPSYSRLPLLHLTCVFLVFLVKGHLSSQHGHCVMAALSPHRCSAAWRVEALFSAVSRFDGFYTLCSL